MKYAKMRASILVVGLAFLLGCSSRESRLPGKWYEEGKPDTKYYIEFYSDKTVAMKAPEMPLSGTWTILSDGRIKSDLEVPYGKLTILGELKGNILSMDMEGRTARFVKMSVLSAHNQTNMIVNIAYKHKYATGQRLWRINSIEPRPPYEMRGIKLTQMRPDGSDEFILDAESALWVGDHWSFENIETRRYDSSGEPSGPVEFSPILEMTTLSETPSDFLN